MLIYRFGNTPTAKAPKGVAEVLFEAFLRRDSLAGAYPMPKQIGDVAVTSTVSGSGARLGGGPQGRGGHDHRAPG